MPKTVKIRLKHEPDHEVEVTEREAHSLRLQGLTVESGTKAKAGTETAK